MSLHLRIDETAFLPFPGISLAAFRCEGLSMAQDSAPAHEAEALAAACLRTLDPEALSTHPRIAAWRNAYRQMGLKPSDYRSSIEQLVRRGLRDGISKVGIESVDLYNRLSIAHLAPMGGYDLDRLPSPAIDLRATRAGDVFTPLGGEPRVATSPGPVLVYAAEDAVLCWALNHRDSQITALHSATDRALFVSEGTDADGAASAGLALRSLRQTLTQAGVTTSDILILDRSQSSGILL